MLLRRTLAFVRPTSGVLVAVLIGAFAATFAASCAQGGNDAGPVRDSCKVRDCGPTQGGEVDPWEEEDFGVIDEDTSIPVVDAKLDAKDGGVVDSADDIVSIDSLEPDTLSTETSI